MELSTSLISLIKCFFEALSEKNIDYAVLRNYEKLPFETSRDIDLYLDQSNYALAFQCLSEAAEKNGFFVVKETQKFKYRKVIISNSESPFDNFFQFDFFMNENLFGNDFFSSLEWHTSVHPDNNLKIPTKLCFVVSLLLTSVFHGDIKSRYIKTINIELADDRLLTEVKTILYKKLGRKVTDSLLCEIRAGNSQFPKLRAKSRLIFSLKHFFGKPLLSLVNIGKFLKGHLLLLMKPPGKFIVFVAPDGSGKTTTINEIVKRAVPEMFTDSIYFHGHLPILPELKSIKNIFGRGNSETSKKKDLEVIQPIQSIPDVKLKYVYITYYAMNHLLMLPRLFIWRWRNRIVIGDRYFYDYYIQNGFNWRSTFYLDLITYLIPKPDYTIFLKNTPEIVFSRKPEISVDEIQRQTDLIEIHKGKFSNVLGFNTDKSAAEISRQIIKEVSHINVTRERT
jgi:thymidylate kinase